MHCVTEAYRLVQSLPADAPSMPSWLVVETDDTIVEFLPLHRLTALVLMKQWRMVRVATGVELTLHQRAMLDAAARNSGREPG